MARRKIKLTWKHKVGFLLLGVALVGLVELAFRLAGYGGSHPVVRPLIVWDGGEMKGQVLAEPNPEFVAMFFQRTTRGEQRSGGMRRERFLVPKPPGVIRIICLGESTVEGFPMPRNLTSSAILEERLKSLSGDKRFEVINMGVTAIASFPIRKLAVGAIETAEPDLVVIYGAHNEFFGASGVASFQKLGTTVGMMKLSFWLRQRGLYAFTQSMIAGMAKKDVPKDKQPNLIEVMAGTSFVDPKGELHKAAEKSLESNWRAIARAARKNNVPVIFCTVASNEKGMAPMVSSELDVPPKERSDFTAALARAADSVTTNTITAVAELRSLVDQAPHHALAHYRLAQALETSGEKESSDEYYRLSRDLDALPWRANRAKNEVIRKVAREENTLLAEVEGAFAAAAGGATGWVHFDDHVHPSLQGQALLADTILHAILKAELFPLDRTKADPLPNWTTVTTTLKVHPLERVRVLSTMLTLYSTPPLRLNNDPAFRSLQERVQKMMDSADETEKRVILRWNQACLSTGVSLPISYFAASQYLAEGDGRTAATFGKAAVLNADPYTNERTAAQFLALTSSAHEGIPSDVFQRLVTAAIGEAKFVESMPEQSSALLAYALSGLHLLAEQPESAEKWRVVMEEKRKEAGVREKVFLGSLPPPEQLPGVVKLALSKLSAPSTEGEK